MNSLLIAIKGKIKVIKKFVSGKIPELSQDNKLNKISQRACDSGYLNCIDSEQVYSYLNSSSTNEVWSSLIETIKSLNLPEMTGGVNPGDQRAIFYLITALKSHSILEIGTHIGCSTVHIALALKSQEKTSLTTVDIKDVNDPITQPWKEYQSSLSPQEMINKVGAQNYTKFVVSNSLDFFKGNSQKFDFIFLDGLHDAYMVYQEIPIALQHLNEKGVILLHDYFPHGESIWENCPPITGPYLAIKRLQAEGANIKALPLGNLP